MGLLEGDTVASKLGVICEPEVKILDLTPRHKFVLLASDGLWDALSVEDAAQIIGKHGNAQMAATDVTEKGIKKLYEIDSFDNTSTIVIKLDFPNGMEKN